MRLKDRSFVGGKSEIGVDRLVIGGGFKEGISGEETLIGGIGRH
jgi:hypothetical protein